MFEFCNRIDLVWDIYLLYSLKKFCRDNRGCGIPVKVTLQMKLPANYMGFLRVDSNKEAFFLLIALELSKIVLPPNKRLYTTFKDQVLCTEGSPLTLTRCTHEEADTRMFVHVADQVSHGYTRILMKTPDSDNVVLAVYVFGQIPGIRELWIAYGSYPNLR